MNAEVMASCAEQAGWIMPVGAEIDLGDHAEALFKNHEGVAGAVTGRTTWPDGTPAAMCKFDCGCSLPMPDTMLRAEWPGRPKDD